MTSRVTKLVLLDLFHAKGGSDQMKEAMCEKLLVLPQSWLGRAARPRVTLAI